MVRPHDEQLGGSPFLKTRFRGALQCGQRRDHLEPHRGQSFNATSKSDPFRFWPRCSTSRHLEFWQTAKLFIQVLRAKAFHSCRGVRNKRCRLDAPVGVLDCPSLRRKYVIYLA